MSFIDFLISCSFDLDSQTWSITEPALNSQVLKYHLLQNQILANLMKNFHQIL